MATQGHSSKGPFFKGGFNFMMATQGHSSKGVLNVALELCWPRRAKVRSASLKGGLNFMLATRPHTEVHCNCGVGFALATQGKGSKGPFLKAAPLLCRARRATVRSALKM